MRRCHISNSGVAQRLELDRSTVRRRRNRSVDARCDGLARRTTPRSAADSRRCKDQRVDHRDCFHGDGRRRVTDPDLDARFRGPRGLLDESQITLCREFRPCVGHARVDSDGRDPLVDAIDDGASRLVSVHCLESVAPLSEWLHTNRTRGNCRKIDCSPKRFATAHPSRLNNHNPPTPQLADRTLRGSGANFVITMGRLIIRHV